MKKCILLLVLFMATLSVAQTANKAIAWSGIITDSSGDIFANTTVTLKFSITQNGTAIFSEQHNLTTDANGFINANIGEGMPLVNSLSIVYFDTVNLKLKIEADSGSGFVTLSDDFFKAVPYSKGSETSRELAKNDELVLLNSNNISFYSNGYQGEINENGLKLVDLAGTGTREVVTNAEGQLQRKPIQTKYLSISGAAFNIPDFNFNNSGLGGLYNSSFNTITNITHFVPIYLPNNAKITNLKISFLDNISSGYELQLVRSGDSNLAALNLVQFDTNTTSPSSIVQISEFSNLDIVINNQLYSYFLRLRCLSWPYDFSLGLRRVLITYEE